MLGAHGFEPAAKGTDHFTCLVERSWDKTFDDPEFWNQKMRGPVCMNEAAVRTVLPMILERAEWALSGVSRDEMAKRSKTSAKANTPPATGAMSYMLSKQQYLSDNGGHPWHPHVMFFSPATDGSAWGADVKGSPVLSAPLTSQVTLFFIPVQEMVRRNARGLRTAATCGIDRTASSLNGARIREGIQRTPTAVRSAKHMFGWQIIFPLVREPKRAKNGARKE